MGTLTCTERSLVSARKDWPLGRGLVKEHYPPLKTNFSYGLLVNLLCSLALKTPLGRGEGRHISRAPNKAHKHSVNPKCGLLLKLDMRIG
jgi:hypothetical protein